jgi:hypothetical protein
MGPHRAGERPEVERGALGGRRPTPHPIGRCDDPGVDAATELESRVEDLVDVIVNEIARSGLTELDVVRRLAERHGYDMRPANTA